MTLKILTDDIHKVISRSNIRPADTEIIPNLRLSNLDGEDSCTNIITSGN